MTNQGTTLGADYSVSSFVITLSINQRWASVPVTINDDDLPEFAESFVIKLVSGSVTGGAMIGTPNQCVVTIAENDYPYGLIGTVVDENSHLLLMISIHIAGPT